MEAINVYPIWDPKVRANPQALYERMRHEAPIYRGIGPMTGRAFWFFTRYDDCVNILKDQRFGKEFQNHLSPEDAKKALPPDFEENPMFDVVNRQMLNLDPPDHTRLRMLVHKAFTPSRVENLKPRIQQIADELLNRFPEHGEIDLIAMYALPLPITVIAEMLGVPVADQDKFRKWTQDLLFGPSQEAAATSAMEFMMYMHHMIDARIEHPQDDILTGLVQAEENGDKLNRTELLSMIFLLLVAGHETTVNLIANGTLALIQYPDQMQTLRDNPNLIKSAIEEMLRFNGPVETPTMRWAFEDVEIDGHVIEAGDIVMPALLGANRDPNVFQNPNVFDITRNPNKHIAFGSGIHYCLGAPLARMEGQIAINTLLAKLPKLDIHCTIDDLMWNDNLLIHGMKALPVRF